MKKALSLLMCVLVLTLSVAMPVSAAAADNAPERSVSVEYLDDGSYFVIEVVQNPQSARTSYKSGSKTATHYGANGVAIWNVTVYGEFTYTPGVSSKATSSTATVGIIDRNASFVSKNAYTLGNAALANANVKYLSESVSKTVSLRCDSYGHLS